MIMADFVFNSVKGEIARYCSLPETNDAIIIVLLEQAGLASDATMKDLDTLAQVLSSSTEQTTMGRKTATNVTVTVDDSNDYRMLDMDNLVWTAATGNAVSALLVCYDPDTTGGDDTTIIPIAKYDFIVTPSGGDVTMIVPTNGFLRAV